MMETYSFGEWLKQRREKLRLTQRELALSTHCSIAMIKKIEADERHASPELAELLAVRLDIPEADIPRFIEVARGERPVDFLTQGGDSTEILPLSAAQPVSLLPKPATPFIGRADELAAILERLANPECRLLTLAGAGGIGKTRLAIAAAQAQEKRLADGAAFVPLAAITNAALIADAIARGLRLTLTGTASEQVQAYLRRRNMLLVLDNCEQLDGDLTWLSDLLAHAPGVKLLTTSRERLQLSEEWVYVVPELAQSVTLFAETARRVKQNFDAGREQVDIARICQLVENLPLAVELAAGWTTIMSCVQIADHIQRDIKFLATDVRNVPERHRSVQAVFDHSWKLLSPAEQNALMRLSVFRGGCQAEQAEIVARANLPLLRRLVEKSLVRVGENDRYDLHELLRQYVAQKLEQSGGEAETQQLHFDAYLALAEQLDTQQFGAESMTAVARFEQEQDNIRAALSWSLERQEIKAALSLMYHLWFYWGRRGYYREGGEWSIRIIDQMGTLESLHMCVALCIGASFCFILGRFGEGETLARRALAMAHRLEDSEALIMALSTYTFTSVNLDQALDELHKGIRLIQETGEMRQMLPMFYLGAATWFHSGGRYAEADDYYRKSITIFRQIGMVDMIAEPLGRIAELALQEGRLQAAYDLTMESIVAARAEGYDVVFGTWGGTRLGLIQFYLGDIEGAQRSLEAALLLYNDNQDSRVKQEALAILSEVALARGDMTAAAEHMQACLEICRNLYLQLQATGKLSGTPEAMPIDLMSLSSRAALVTAAQGHHERAVTLYSIAESFRAQSGQVMIPPLQASLDKVMKIARAHLSETAFEATWRMGAAMSLGESLEFLLADP